jgi:hypothetical protein
MVRINHHNKKPPARSRVFLWIDHAPRTGG